MPAPINEASTAFLRLVFRDRDGVLAIPVAISYRIDCLDDLSEVRPWTNLPAPSSSTVEMVLTSDDNQLQDQERDLETHRVTFDVFYGIAGGYRKTAFFDYVVRNLLFIN